MSSCTNYQNGKGKHIIMVQLLSFALGALAVPVSHKIMRIIYRTAPYLYALRKNGEPSEEFVVIAGATDGIGLQYLRALSSQYKIVAIGRNAAKLSQLKESYPNIQTLRIDFTKNVCNELAVEEANKAISGLAGQLKVKGVINCVGLSHFSKYEETSLEAISRVNQTNIQSIHFLLKLQHSFKQQQISSASPFFINVSSATAIFPNKYSAAYSATKAYISNLVTVASLEDSAVTYLDVQPWYVKTKMVSNLDSWDTALPQQIVEGSLKMLGRRASCCGCIKHQLFHEFHFITTPFISKRTESLMLKLQRVAALRASRKKGPE